MVQCLLTCMSIACVTFHVAVTAECSMVAIFASYVLHNSEKCPNFWGPKMWEVQYVS